MQKKISLLYINGNAGSISKDSEQAIYNLNIDRMIALACDNKRHRDYFLSVLCHDRADSENAAYRAEIIRDFLKNPSLLSEMIQLFRGYDNLMAETDEVLKEIFRYGMPATSSGMLDCAYEELYVNAHFARNVIAYFSEICELFESCEVSGRGLTEMKSFCAAMKESKCISELENAAERFRSENLENYRFEINTRIDEAMRVCACSVSEITDANAKEKRGILSVFKKKTETVVDIGTSALDNCETALAQAMGELSGLFSDIAGGIYEVFRGMSEELIFYSVALQLTKLMEKTGMPYCFPSVSEAEADELEAECIWDMLLLSEGKGKDDIVTNNISLSKSIIARGDNNCGKTSFLRAVGSSVIFAQNGLPVPAKSMRSSVRGAIFTHFSSAEKDFSDGDAAGRFEGEVKDMAAIMNAIKPYSLVLLNETFQTTAYREGAQGMKEILDVLPKIKCKYIFVSHMKALFSLFTENEVSVLTAKGYVLQASGDSFVCASL